MLKYPVIFLSQKSTGPIPLDQLLTVGPEDSGKEISICLSCMYIKYMAVKLYMYRQQSLLFGKKFMTQFWTNATYTKTRTASAYDELDICDVK